MQEDPAGAMCRVLVGNDLRVKKKPVPAQPGVRLDTCVTCTYRVRQRPISFPTKGMVSDDEIVTVVSPSRTKHVVYGKKELVTSGRLYDALNLDSELAGNLRQLCGYDRAPRGSVRRSTAGCQLFEDVKFLYREDSLAVVPVVGFTKKDGWIERNVPELKGQMSEGSLKNLLNGSKPHINGSKLLQQTPAAATELGDGESLVGLQRRALPHQPLDFGYPDLLNHVSDGAQVWRLQRFRTIAPHPLPAALLGPARCERP